MLQHMVSLASQTAFILGWEEKAVKFSSRPTSRPTVKEEKAVWLARLARGRVG